MKVSHSGNRDPLTGVATESALVRFAAAALEAVAPGGPPVCFLQIDVDGLAGIHQAHGAAMSDAVLLGVADCLQEGIRGPDLAGRSADGFGICMPNSPPPRRGPRRIGCGCASSPTRSPRPAAR